MIQLDGTQGEGGGQILRSALALSMATGQPFSISDIRGGRRKPGLLRQHLTCVRTAAHFCGATLQGDALGSRSLVFEPGPLRGGELDVSVGSAGSTMLVLQSVAPALLHAPEPTTLRVSGGTHNPSAPSFEFLTTAWAPMVSRIGGRIDGTLGRHGFFPAGGGHGAFTIVPAPSTEPLVLTTTAAITQVDATAVVSQLPRLVGKTQRDLLHDGLTALGVPFTGVRVVAVRNSNGPGNIVQLTVHIGDRSIVFISHGWRGRASTEVVGEALGGLRAWIEAGVNVDEHLADQLLLPMALGAGGRFTTTAPTDHTRTNAAVISRFLPVDIALEDKGKGRWLVTVARR